MQIESLQQIFKSIESKNNVFSESDKKAIEDIFLNWSNRSMSVSNVAEPVQDSLSMIEIDTDIKFKEQRHEILKNEHFFGSPIASSEKSSGSNGQINVAAPEFVPKNFNLAQPQSHLTNIKLINYNQISANNLLNRNNLAMYNNNNLNNKGPVPLLDLPYPPYLPNNFSPYMNMNNYMPMYPPNTNQTYQACYSGQPYSPPLNRSFFGSTYNQNFGPMFRQNFNQ